MRNLLWVVVVAGCTPGCTQGPEERIEIVCNTFCDCVSTLPAAVAMCVVDRCKPSLTTVTDECLACVYDHETSCSLLESDCKTTCFPQVVDLKGSE